MRHYDGAKFLYLLTGLGIGAGLAGVFFARFSLKEKSLLMEEALETWEDEGGASRNNQDAALDPQS